MTSPGILDSLNQHPQVATAELRRAAEQTAAAQADELPLALMIGVNNQAWFFTTHRLLMLKKVRRLARQLAGRRLIDFTGSDTSLRTEEVLSQTRIKREIPLAGISWLEAERMYRVGAVALFADGRRYELTVNHKRHELLPYVKSLRESYGIQPSAARHAMNRDLGTWGRFCLATGSLTFLLSFAYPGLLEPTWGLTVALIGAGAWWLSEPAMFIIFGFGMVWAAVMNLCGLNSSLLSKGHLPLGVPFQLYWGLMLFSRYQKFEYLYDVEHPAAVSDRFSAGSSFSAAMAEMPLLPLLSLFIAITEIILLSLHFTAVWQWPDSLAALLSRGHLHLAMIGMAVGVASVCSRRSRRGAAMTGIAVNALTAAVLMTLMMTKWQQP